MTAAVFALRWVLPNVPHGPSTESFVPNSAKPFFCVASTGRSATPLTIGFLPPSAAYSDWLPTTTAPSSTTWIRLLFANFWPHFVPSSSAEVVKQVLTLSGWPWTPPRYLFTYSTAVCTPFVQPGPTRTWPPWVLTAPITPGRTCGFAAPALPPT